MKEPTDEEVAVAMQTVLSMHERGYRHAVDMADENVDYRPMSDFQVIDMDEWRKMERINASQLRVIERMVKHRGTLEGALVAIQEILNALPRYNTYTNGILAIRQIVNKALKAIRASERSRPDDPPEEGWDADGFVKGEGGSFVDDAKESKD